MTSEWGEGAKDTRLSASGKRSVPQLKAVVGSFWVGGSMAAMAGFSTAKDLSQPMLLRGALPTKGRCAQIETQVGTPPPIGTFVTTRAAASRHTFTPGRKPRTWQMRPPRDGWGAHQNASHGGRNTAKRFFGA